MSKNKDASEINTIRLRCFLILDYIKTKVAEKSFESILISQMKAMVKNEYKKGNLKNLAILDKDIYEWKSQLPDPDQKEIDKILDSKLGDGIKSKEKDIDKIIKNGKINNNSEYEFVLNRVEKFYNDKSKIKEIEKLNELLFDYHKSLFE